MFAHLGTVKPALVIFAESSDIEGLQLAFNHNYSAIIIYLHS